MGPPPAKSTGSLFACVRQEGPAGVVIGDRDAARHAGHVIVRSGERFEVVRGGWPLKNITMTKEVRGGAGACSPTVPAL